MNITVIIPDKIIYVDGFAIQCDIEPHKDNLVAVQWYGDKGELEINSPTGYINEQADYTTDVEPYYNIWLSKKEELDAEEERLRTEEEARLSSPEYIKNQFIIAVQDVLDLEAQKLGYDDIKSVCTYATSSIPKFRAEAEAFVLWRDAVWTYCYAELDKVTSGETEIPNLDDFLESLPQLNIVY